MLLSRECNVEQTWALEEPVKHDKDSHPVPIKFILRHTERTYCSTKFSFFSLLLIFKERVPFHLKLFAQRVQMYFIFINKF